jgi:hypothetical protein
MDQTNLAHLIGTVSAVLTLGGVTGITSQDISGFLNVIFGIISVVSFIWAHVAHRKALAAA